jgi:hypothetical protein
MPEERPDSRRCVARVGIISPAGMSGTGNECLPAEQDGLGRKRRGPVRGIGCEDRPACSTLVYFAQDPRRQMYGLSGDQRTNLPRPR